MSLRERVRAALAAREAPAGLPEPWPQGAVPFPVDQLIEAGGALDRAALVGQAINASKVREVAETLAAYVASLPAAQQPHVASRLVAALGGRERFESAVLLKTETSAAAQPEW